MHIERHSISSDYLLQRSLHAGQNLRVEHLPRFDEAHRVQRIFTYLREFPHAVQDDLCNIRINGRETGSETADSATTPRLTATKIFRRQSAAIITKL